MNDKMTITYQNDDGYAGGKRPFHMTVYKDDFDGTTDSDLEDQLFEVIREDYLDNHCSLYSENLSEFLKWVREP